MFVLPDDANALADAVKTLITNRSLRNELQKGARAAAEKLPRWTDTAKIVSELINKF
jgi:glycosyltransferase involved in cell wall biosynthesis